MFFKVKSGKCTDIPMNTRIYSHFFLWRVTIFQKQRRKLFCKMSDKQHVSGTSASKGRHFIGWAMFCLGLPTSVILEIKWKQHEMSLILIYLLHKKHVTMRKQTHLNILIRCCLFFFIEWSLAYVDLIESNMTH